MLTFGDRQVHIEEIPWYILAPSVYLIIVVIGFLFEQEPALKMQPAGHTFGPGQPKCQIFKTISLSQIGSVMNLSFSVSARFEISVKQAWRSLRIRVIGSGGREVLRSHDSIGSGRMNSTHNFVSFVSSVGGSVTAEVFCSDTLLETFELVLPSAPPADFGRSFLGSDWAGPVCLRGGRVELFTDRAIAPSGIRGWSPIFVGEDFGNRSQEGSRAVQFNVRSGSRGFVGDLMGSALLALVRDPRSEFVIYGDRDFAGQIARLHRRFHERSSSDFCVRRFEYSHELKAISEFDSDDFSDARRILPGPKGSERRAVVVDIEGHPLSIEGGNVPPTIALQEIPAAWLPFTFTDTDRVIVPFQAPASLLVLLRSFATVIVVRPSGFQCQSALERSLSVSGLSFETVNGSLVSAGACDESCGCVADAKYRVEASALSPLLGWPVTRSAPNQSGVGDSDSDSAMK
jgi:hypothetical protein